MTVSGEEAKEWTRVDAPLDERLIIGLLYLCSALFFLVLQFSVIFVCFFDFFEGHLLIIQSGIYGHALPLFHSLPSTQ